MRQQKTDATRAIEELRKIPPFDQCDPDHIERHGKLVRSLELEPDETLFEQGNVARGVYMVKSGRLKAVKNTEDGGQTMLWFVHPGEMTGMNAVINKEAHEYEVVSVKASEVLLFPAEPFKLLMAREPELRFSLIRSLCRNIDHMEERIINKGLKDTRRRVIDLFKSLIEKKGSSRSPLSVHYTREELADIVGTTQYYLYKILNNLSKEGAITMNKGRITIQDVRRFLTNKDEGVR